jgi:DNA topoisomerase-1
VNEKCPACGSYMVKKYNKTRGNYLECSNSECKYRKYDVEENKDEKIK